MDPATPVNVAKGAIYTSAATGTFAAARALYQGSRHPAPLAMSAAVNGAIAGSIFFSIRDVVIGPLLHLTTYSDKSSDNSSSTSSQPSWSLLRTHNLPESAISGAITGGIISAWQRGTSGLWAGFRTGGIVCTALQLGFNELGITRLKIVSSKIQESRQPQAPPTPSEPDDPGRLSIVDRLMSIIGFRKLTDEEYLKVLKKQRNEALAKIAVLEQERSERAQDDVADQKPT